MKRESTWIPTGSGRLDRLGTAGRILLTSDGTVTSMLEHIAGERIVTAGLTQSPVSP